MKKVIVLILSVFFFSSCADKTNGLQPANIIPAKTSQQIDCIIPASDIMYGTVEGDVGVSALKQEILSAGYNSKVGSIVRLREEVPNMQKHQYLRFVYCIDYNNGVLSKEEYRRVIGDIDKKIFDIDVELKKENSNTLITDKNTTNIFSQGYKEEYYRNLNRKLLNDSPTELDVESYSTQRFANYGEMVFAEIRNSTKMDAREVQLTIADYESPIASSIIPTHLVIHANSSSEVALATKNELIEYVRYFWKDPKVKEYKFLGLTNKECESLPLIENQNHTLATRGYGIPILLKYKSIFDQKYEVLMSTLACFQM